MSNMREPGKPLSLEHLMGTLKAAVEKAEQERDNIAVDASEAEQKNWFFFNGKVTALNELEAQLRLWLQTFPLPACIDLPEPGQVNVKLSNGETVNLREDKNRLHISQFDIDGEVWWICSIQPGGVLVAPNSGDGCGVLAKGLRNHDAIKE